MADVPSDVWLRDFHAGNGAVLQKVYEDHFDDVHRAVRRRLMGADAETVTHEIFYRLLSEAKLRQNFSGGHFQGWLMRVATNAAHDYMRRYRFEHAESPSRSGAPDVEASTEESFADEVEAKVLIDRFRRERLPPQWTAVFEARFIRELPQRQAAAELKMHRTTLVYQEQRIRALLREFLLGEPAS